MMRDTLESIVTLIIILAWFAAVSMLGVAIGEALRGCIG